MKIVKKIIIILILLFLTIGVIIIAAIPDFDFAEKDYTFSYDNKKISARLVLPKELPGPFPVAVFIHGDGPVNKTGNDDYLYHWQRLTDAGIACFSWDKQGVDGSEGNWEHQDMEDRAREVVAAIDFLKTRPEVKSDSIGLVGFSQAGWVMPYVSTISDYPDFIVSVSGAINVFEQGEYLHKKRLHSEGFSEEEINRYLKLKNDMYNQMNSGMTYEEYIKYWDTYFKSFEGDDASPMSYDRFVFSGNTWPDARDHLKNIECPVLGIFGDQDVNVDYNQSVSVYREEFERSGNNDFIIKLFAGGTHALTRQDLYADEKISLAEVLIYGEDIYVVGYLDLITEWILERVYTSQKIQT